MSRSLSERLAALQKSVQSTPTAEHPAHPVANLSVGDLTATTPQETLSDLGFEHRTDENGQFWVRMLRYDALTRHGQHRFAKAAACAYQALAKAASVEPFTVADIRYYDTETTGLGTGAGTFPFLHAVGQFETDDFVVYQYFLDDYAEEPALLRQLLQQHLQDGTVLASFNGRSFDWQLLQTRLRMYKLDIPTGIRHLDLLYPSRRLWRSRLQSVSLANVEQMILGFHRTDDLPGKEAPARYFAYVSDRAASQIEPVLEHNALDVCSLAVLGVHLDDVMSGNIEVSTAAEHVALAKWYDEWEAYELVNRCFQAAIACPDANWQTHWLASLHAKRQKQWHIAVPEWEQMSSTYPWSVLPAVELAKYYEHRQADLPLAKEWANVALTRALDQRRMHGTATSNDVVDELRWRVQRIHRKLARIEFDGA